MSDAAGMPTHIDVTVELSAEIQTAGELALCLAVADHLDADDAVSVTGANGPIESRLLSMPHGTRMHVVDAPLGDLSVRYTARVPAGPAPATEVTAADRLTYVLPSRYCPSDTLGGWARSEFAAASDDTARALRVVEWVNARTAYTPGSTGPTDDALVPFLTGQGVCRDYAHLVVTVLRSLDIPARYVSVYAPGLDPMDGHAVVEVALDGQWHVVDATRLAPRRSLVRVGTGRDAADVALMTTLGAAIGAPLLTVLATADPVLPVEDPAELVTLR